MNFNEFELQDVLDIQWGDTKTTKSSYVPFGYRAYSASGPDGFLVKFDYEEDGVVLSAIGANCGVTYFASGKWSCIKNTIRILKRSDEIDLAYFYYMTKAQDFWELRGSAQPFISQTDIRQKRVRVPELSGQRYISSTLQSLDDAIVANGEMSQTLDSIAQALFRSWFVDFDPVRAKMAGEKPVGMDDATAALFPDTMEASELGDIPVGWEWNPLDEIAEISGGKQLNRDEFRDGGLNPVFGGAGEMGRTNLQNADGFVITVGRVGAYCGQFFSYRGSAWINNNASRLKPREGYSPEWLFLSLRELDIDSIKKGAAQPYVSNGDLGASNLIIAPQPILDTFEDVIGPIFQMRETLERQVRNLVHIRDTLLPRLISGELQVPEDLVA